MIFLTKLNGEEIVINCEQIHLVEMIPESKVVLANREFFIVKEGPQEIINKSIEYKASIINRAEVKKLEMERGK